MSGMCEGRWTRSSQSADTPLGENIGIVWEYVNTHTVLKFPIPVTHTRYY